MKKLFLILLVITIILVGNLLSKKPENFRDWEEGFERLSSAEFIDDKTIHIINIRDWTYTDDRLISADYIDETYNLDDLVRVWFLLEPFSKWEAIAHTYFVFDFKDKEPVAFSIEARREKGEDYDALRAMFRTYELYYSWGTERDFTGRRAYKDGETLYMYPLKLSHERAVNLFKTVSEETNTLAKQPRFYNTLTSNCTNELAKVVKKANPDAIPWYAEYIPPGYSDHYLYDWGYIDTEVSKEELHEKYFITDRVKKQYKEGFSEQIRNDL